MKHLLLLFLFVNIALSMRAQNVGIGTTSPLEKLHISNGQLRLSRSAFFDNNIIFNMPAASSIVAENQGLQFNLSDVSKAFVGYSSSTITGNILRFSHSTIGASDLVVAQSGNIGIGTSLPSEKLHVTGNIKTSGSLNVEGTSILSGNVLMSGIAYVLGDITTNAGIKINNAGILQFADAGTNKSYVQLSGDNLRMGTNSGNTTGDMIVRLNGNDLFTFKNYLNSGSAQLYLNYNGVQTGLLHATSNGDISLTNVIAGKQVRLGGEIYIDGTGNKTGFGYSTPAERVHVNGNVRIDGELRGENTGTYNMMPLCYARINSSGSVYAGTPNLTASKSASHEYIITCPGISVNSVFQVTPHSGASGLMLAKVSYSAPGEAKVYFTELGAIINDPGGFFGFSPAPFFIVIYNP